MPLRHDHDYGEGQATGGGQSEHQMREMRVRASEKKEAVATAPQRPGRSSIRYTATQLGEMFCLSLGSFEAASFAT